MSNNPGSRNAQEVMNEVIIPQLTRGMAARDNNWHGSGIVRARYTSEPIESITYIEVDTVWGETVRLQIIQVEPEVK